MPRKNRTMFTQEPPSKEFWLDGRTVELIATSHLQKAIASGVSYRLDARDAVIRDVKAVGDGGRELLDDEIYDEVIHTSAYSVCKKISKIKTGESADYYKNATYHNLRASAAWELARAIACYRWRSDRSESLGENMRDPEYPEMDDRDLQSEFSAILAADLNASLDRYFSKMERAYRDSRSAC